jgi:menaquinone-9 beta-reductase
LNENNPIEIYFLKDILPGYFWIFHLPGGKANVGMGMLASAVINQGINFKQKFDELICNEPLRSRFKYATRNGEIKGHMLPLGFDKRIISGNRFLLTGDAAALIDPLTGEGVGNAMRSGRVAVAHILECFRTGIFSAEFN